MFQLAKHIHAKYQILASIQTDLDKLLDFFQEKFKIFLRKFQNLKF
jgi:hypothetical protein